MSTRSRRSTGADTGGVNINLIQLYDVGRLKQELEARGLSAVGKKSELADRLYDAVTGQTSAAAAPTPPPKPKGRKSTVKAEPVASIEVKQEPVELPEPVNKSPKAPKRPRKSKDANVSVSEAETAVESNESPKKKMKIKAEVVEEEAVKKKKTKVKQEPEEPEPEATSSKAPVATEQSTSAQEFTEDVPLLSLLAPKKIKKEDPQENNEVGHAHGTRRATAMQNAQNQAKQPVIERKKFFEIANSDIFDDDNSPHYVQPEGSPPRRRESIGHKESVKEPRVEREQKKKPVIRQEPPPPRKAPITSLWAQKCAELKRPLEAAAVSSPAAENKPKLEQRPKPKPLPSTSSTSTFVLDDILSTHEKQALEQKRKQEEEERQVKEAERRNREKMAEFRRKQAEQEAKRAERMKNVPFKPKPMVEPKTLVELRPHPYAKPVPLEVKTEPKKTEAPVAKQIVVPPPPPPRKSTSLSSDSPASAGSRDRVNSVSAQPLVVRPRLLPPPPPPRKISREADDVQKPDERQAEEKPVVAESTTAEGEVDTTTVSIVAEAFLRAMKSRGSVETDDAEGTSVAEKDAAEAVPFEEYDPFTQNDEDADLSAYVPSAVVSRNHTMLGEEEMESDEEPSDDEVRGEMEDEALDEEEESDDESGSEDGAVPVTVSPRKTPQKRMDSGMEVNPRDLLLKATTVVFSNPDESADSEGPQYVQMPCGDDYEPEEEERKTPEYHGEPVPPEDEIDYFALGAGLQPKKKKEIVVEEEKLPSDENIEPDYYNADLHIKGAADKNWLIEPENADGQALMWGGVKSTYGIRLPFRDVRNQGEETMEVDGETAKESKKIVFQVKIVEFLPTKHLPFEEVDPHDVRVGFSLRSTPTILGESPDSYCITSLGKKATNNVFSDFGKDSIFRENDIVTACINLEEGSISYWKNDDLLGVAFTKIALPDDDAIYPHICIKNCRVAVNFGAFEGNDEEHPWPKNSEWRFMTSLGRGDLERSQKPPESKGDCTVIMMVGLPGVGKTTWVREYLRDHPEETWTLINTESVLAAMKVNGVSRKRAHQGRWDMIMGLIGKSLQRSVLLAARRRKNYILDMTNTSRETRKKRLQLFEEFRRKCVIIMPPDEEMLDRQARQARQEGTALMPPEAMLEMKAVISLPSQEFEPFEDVYFIEPPVHRIQECIDQINRYNEEARPWFQKKYRRRRSQMIGLGDGFQRDSNLPRKPMQPLTVLPQLKVAVIPLDDPSHPAPISATSSYDSAPSSASALGFTVVEDRTPTMRPPMHISIDTSIPPPNITPSMRPLVRVTIEDIPATAVSVPFKRDSGIVQASVEEKVAELNEQELKELRESVKAANPSGNPMMSEAIMRSRLMAMQLKKAEKKEPIPRVPLPSPSAATPTTATTSAVAPPATPTGAPIKVLGGRSIPTIGTPISIDISQASTTSNFSSPVTHHQPSPRAPLASPALTLPGPVGGLPAPYLHTPPPNNFSQPPPTPQFQFSTVVPPPGFPFSQPPPHFGMPPPGFAPNGLPTGTMTFSPASNAWSQQNSRSS